MSWRAMNQEQFSGGIDPAWIRDNPNMGPNIGTGSGSSIPVGSTPIPNVGEQGHLFNPHASYLQGTGKKSPPTEDITLLHRTHNPNFRIDPDHPVNDVLDQGSKFFGAPNTKGSLAWSSYARKRGYIAHVSVKGAVPPKPEDYDGFGDRVKGATSDYWNGGASHEVLLSKAGIAKAKVTHVVPARIHRPADMPLVKIKDPGSGPTGIVKSPRQPQLPNMEGTRGKAPKMRKSIPSTSAAKHSEGLPIFRDRSLGRRVTGTDMANRGWSIPPDDVF